MAWNIATRGAANSVLEVFHLQLQIPRFQAGKGGAIAPDIALALGAMTETASGEQFFSHNGFVRPVERQLSLSVVVGLRPREPLLDSSLVIAACLQRQGLDLVW